MFVLADFSTAKQAFLSRQVTPDNRVQSFSDNYDSWTAQFPVEVAGVIADMVAHFDYYSHADVNQMLQELHRQFHRLSSLNDCDALHIYLKKSDGHINSSSDYWHDYRLCNNIDPGFCADDVECISKAEWSQIQNIVVVDDCCGTGGSLEDFINRSHQQFTDKTIYYLVLHSLCDADRKLKEIEETYNVKIVLIFINKRDKATKQIAASESDIAMLRYVSSSLRIPDKYHLGFMNSEALMAFYNNTPNNTIGLFWLSTDVYHAPFPRKFQANPSWRNGAAMKEAKKQRKAKNYIAEIQHG